LLVTVVLIQQSSASTTAAMTSKETKSTTSVTHNPSFAEEIVSAIYLPFKFTLSALLRRATNTLLVFALVLTLFPLGKTDPDQLSYWERFVTIIVFLNGLVIYWAIFSILGALYRRAWRNVLN
jgi:hypothetical protein